MKKLSGGPITKENFQDRGSRFIAEHDNEGFLIALSSGRKQGIHFEETPLQWRAWKAYRERLGLSCHFMDQQERSKDCFTVPSEWPHEFDPMALVQDDYAACAGRLRRQ